VDFDFFVRNQNNIQITKQGFVRDTNGKGVVIRLAIEGSQITMKNGVSIAERFGVNVPTLAKFEYVGPFNVFFVSFLPDGNAQVANNVEEVVQVVDNPEVVQEVVEMEEVAQEVIDISSDEEVPIAPHEEDEQQNVQQQQDLHRFVQTVTASVARSARGRLIGKVMVSPT